MKVHGKALARRRKCTLKRRVGGHPRCEADLCPDVEEEPGVEYQVEVELRSPQPPVALLTTATNRRLKCDGMALDGSENTRKGGEV